ncbi:MAG TPA: LysE family transporter [Stellaceae bacterium]|jgi:threonine/homoserine/homoserine lactone efflux protein|nr:LysE family transporter [Stellaceae bacterium]
MIFLTLLKGIAVGIVIALPVGPVGVLCVRRCLFEGAVMGFVSGLGAAFADATFGAIAALGLTVLRDWLLDYQDWFGLAGGLFLLGLGVKALFIVRANEPEPLAGEAMLGAFASAYALTIANPITLLSFAAIFAKLGADAVTGLAGASALVGGVFVGSLLWWLGLSFGIAALRNLAGEVVMRWLNRISGAILLASGVGLLILATRGLVG